ncbi:MAG TPA: tripartite tricarboxylate transporter substrate-binding protein [Xanthobacteraceae bacterium]|jgi:tripartite-type tricarboxylate transporter receptor subunit TctC
MVGGLNPCGERAQRQSRASVWRRAFGTLLVSVVSHTALLETTRAATFPAHPITIVVPLAAGGAIDAVARLIQPKLEQSLGQPIVVVDRPGASGIVGASSVARAEPDGYTLLMTPSTFTVDPAVNSTLPYDVQHDFQPIAVVVENSMLFVVNPKLPVHSLAEFVSAAKASPDKINYATPGTFSQARLLIDAWSAEVGIRLQQIPFKGAAPAVLSTVSGDTQMTLASPLIVLSQVQGGALRAIATAASERDPNLPNISTTSEAGFPHLVADQWVGLLTTMGTPPDIVLQLNAAVNEAVRDKDVQAMLAQQGIKTVGGTSEQFRSLIASDVANWKRIASVAKIEPQ